mgnify:CR=1 FL=1
MERVYVWKRLLLLESACMLHGCKPGAGAGQRALKLAQQWAYFCPQRARNSTRRVLRNGLGGDPFVGVFPHMLE